MEKHRIRDAIYSLALLFLLGVMGGLLWTLSEVRAKIDEVLSPREGPKMVEKTFEWVSGGIKQTLKLTKNTGESADDFAARCAAELAAQLEQFPKDA